MSLPDSCWNCKPYSYAAADAVALELGLSPSTAAILVRRGCQSAEDARRFLAADERHDPSGFDGIGDACALILGHAHRGSRILVHGDYDVDGVASTAILIKALRALGADPTWLLPSRFEDGYGLARSSVERMAADGVGLLITADCAITSADEVELARSLGVDVVVTDHHRPADRLPDCPIVHPVVSGYPFPDLCAAGVAHKLAGALYENASIDPARADEDLDLVALATVADLVPLRGENRRLVAQGVTSLSRTAKPGLRALMKIAAVDPGRVDAGAIGYRLAPRINAAGRLQRADAALELLLTADEQRAAEIADELDLLNRERQDTETRLLFAAEAARADQEDAPAYVLAGEGWHPGVIGIVASRLVERHHRPTVLIALDGDSGRGSGRSIPAFDLHAGLAATSQHLGRFGGHRAAAGLDIERRNVDAFRDAFVAHAASVLTADDLMPEERVDALVPGAALGLGLCEELRRLEPFGFGNPAPTLLVPAARIANVRPMGQEGAHASFSLAAGGARARAVAFRTSPKALASRAGAPHDVAVKLELNEWNGAQEARLVLKALCPTRPGAVEDLGAGEGFWASFERELNAPLEPALATAGGGAAGTVGRGGSAVGGAAGTVGGAGSAIGGAALTLPEQAPRAVRDRRGQGVAGVAGDLLAGGGSVLVVCADVPRRRAGLEELIAGGTGIRGRGRSGGATPPLPVCSWAALEREPQLAAPYDHVVALDPPAHADAEFVLASLPAPAGGGFGHLAWGGAEVEFALAVARAGLDLRPSLIGLYRELRDRPAAGPALERVLRGDGAHPRPPEVAARMVRVLRELGLVAFERDGAGHPACRVLEAPRTALEKSAAHRAYLARLSDAERRLAASMPGPPVAAPGARPAPAPAPAAGVGAG